MNLLAILSIDQAKPLGQMEWYGTVVPLISLQLPQAGVNEAMTCGELLALILELPSDVRINMLKVTVTDGAATENALQEVKQESHRSMLVGLSAALLVIGVIVLLGFYFYTRVEGNPVDQEELKSLWEIVKEAAGLVGDIAKSME